MKKYFFLSIPLLFALFFSCTKEMNIETNNKFNDKSTLEEFSILLSKAVYSEPELRSFFKSEALQKKDYDYDVFYPYVKDELVDGRRTFEEILLQYDNDNILTSVLSAHPLLTIFVPDWSWVNENCFTINNWDTTLPDVGTSYISEEKEHRIYWNGQYAFAMTNGEFCSTPILIVKDNDRIVANTQTKCLDKLSYKLYCDHYIDLSSQLKTKTSSYYYTYDLPYEVASDYINTDILTNRSRSAYTICSNDNRIFQRDHIYYGMTSETNSGSVNPNYYETLYRFKLSPNTAGLTDDPIGKNTGDDFKTNTYYYEASWGTATKLTKEQIVSKAWGKGKADLYIRAYVGDKVITKNVGVNFSDAFYTKKVELRENYNWLGALKSRTYYLGIGDSGNLDEWLEPKWIQANLQLFYWDLSKYPTSYFVEFEEYDKATKTTRSFEKSYSFAINLNYTSEETTPGDSIAVKKGYGITTSLAKTHKITKTIETTETSDNLGNFIVEYTDKIVLTQDDTRAKIKTYSTGGIDVQLLTLYE